MHIRIDPSFFLKKSTGAPQGVELVLDDKVPLPPELLRGLNQFGTRLVLTEVILADLQDTLLDNSSPLEYPECFLPYDLSPPHVQGTQNTLSSTTYAS
ncbi:hypothetical protein Tco_0833337 [Tanacetum coccineum]